MPYVFLSVAILMEVIATTALKSSDGFNRLGYTTISLIGYLIAFYCLSITLRDVPTGVAYAIWSGVGIFLIVAIAWYVHGQALSIPELMGIALIIAGVIVLNLFTKSPEG